MGPLALILVAEVLSPTSSTSTSTPPIDATPPMAQSAARLSHRLGHELGAQIFFRARGSYGGATWAGSYEITRARLAASLRFEDLLELVLEPDFAGFICTASGSVCDGVELSDIFLDIEPAKRWAIRIGQAKSPYGIIETTSEWRLPVLHRGLVSRLVISRLGFGGRRLGVRARWRPKVTLKPSVELGVYNDPAVGDALDGAARIALGLTKGARLEWSGYARSHATVTDDYGLATALAVGFDRAPVFALAELGVVRARRLTLSGPSPDDATALSARALFAFSVPLSGEVELEPYAALDLFDPSATTRGDLGGSIRGGFGVFVSRALRLSLEAERRGGQAGFVSPNETLVTFLVGGSLKDAGSE